MNGQKDPRLARYIGFFERLTPGALAELDRVMTDDVRFADPFNDVTGLDATRRVFVHMFRDLDAAAFRVTHAGLSDEDETIGLLRWRLDATVRKNGRPLRIDGMSEIRFAADGRVREHVDHWDAGRQVYERVPLLGALLRRIRALLSAGE